MQFLFAFKELFLVKMFGIQLVADLMPDFIALILLLNVFLWREPTLDAMPTISSPIADLSPQSVSSKTLSVGHQSCSTVPIQVVETELSLIG